MDLTRIFLSWKGLIWISVVKLERNIIFPTASDPESGSSGWHQTPCHSSYMDIYQEIQQGKIIVQCLFLISYFNVWHIHVVVIYVPNKCLWYCTCPDQYASLFLSFVQRKCNQEKLGKIIFVFMFNLGINLCFHPFNRKKFFLSLHFLLTYFLKDES